MNKKAWKLFGEVFLKSIIVILGIAIVVFAIYFMIQVFGGGSKKKDTEESTGISTEDLNSEDMNSDDLNTDEPESEDTVSEEPATVEPISSVGHTIEVLNSTDTAGVAAGWQETLNAAGFNVSQIGNYEADTLTNTKIVVTEDGMGQDLLQYFTNATIEVGTIDSGVDIQIIIGTADVQ
jgi:hypothetical protein